MSKKTVKDFFNENQLPIKETDSVPSEVYEIKDSDELIWEIGVK